MVWKHPETGRIYESHYGNRCVVARGKAFETRGNLLAKDLLFNPKTGRWVSKRKHVWGKKHGKKQLADAGYGLFTPGAAGQVTRVAKRRGTTRRAGTKRSLF